ncbi:MAG TPA: primosomal protein N' [Candidatus Saccharimonadales bacterium]|jgi:primosomal protein N' (replication factor Y)
MHYYLVSPLRVVGRQMTELTYHSDDDFLAGHIVSVSVGTKTVPAVVLRRTIKPVRFATKPIDRLINPTPLPAPLLKLHDWLTNYYASHPVAVWQTMLPSGLLKTRRQRENSTSHLKKERTHFVLNEAQQGAFDAIWERPGETSLLRGITGSGKTAIYIELALKTLAEGKSVVVLVPEIALTSQLVADFTGHIPDVLVTHSTMTEAARHAVWLEALQSSAPRVVIGPRSALFTPLPSIGLVVIDECHEPSYKQEKAPRYSALRAASVLSQAHSARLILGSATPSVSDQYLAGERDPSSIVRLDQLARPGAVLPSVTVVDMTAKGNFNRNQFLSDKLLSGLAESLAAGHQTLLFHNRRGSAPITLCENCGWSAACPRCFSPLTLHADQYILRCHLCNHTEPVPTSCPQCHEANIIHKGIGTKRVAEEIAKFFPKANVTRFDGDNLPGETVEASYQALYDGDIDIIVGTQVIAKGLDLPRLRFVGVIQADSGLALPDYQSSERVFQLLAQVSGRVGRNEHKSHVVIQSYQPDHAAVKFGLARDYDSFYEHALAERQRANFPPFCFLLKLVCTYKSEAACIRAARALADTLRPKLARDMELFGPAPAFYERVRESYRWQLVVKSPRRTDLAALIDLVPPQHWQSELDPVNLL